MPVAAPVKRSRMCAKASCPVDRIGFSEAEPPRPKLVPQGEARPVGLLQDPVGLGMEEGVGKQH